MGMEIGILICMLSFSMLTFLIGWYAHEWFFEHRVNKIIKKWLEQEEK